MMSIKKGVDYDRPVWAGDSSTHQVYVFPAHITHSLLSMSPMSMLVSR
jgi:hypothetical protein